MSSTMRLEGKHFGRLLVVKQAGHASDGSSVWLCRCDCGNESLVKGYKLKNGVTKSCGCLRRDLRRQALTTHGQARTRLYKIWLGMKQRCADPNSANYHYYGGRGVGICSEWLNSFKTFQTWAAETGYQKNLTLDREDVNGDYTPGNCRWATVKEQANNKRNNRLVTYNGETKTVSQWADVSGLRHTTICARLNSATYPLERLLEPVGV